MLLAATVLFAVMASASAARMSLHSAADRGQVEPLKVAIDGKWDEYEERRIKPDINGKNKKGQVALNLAVCNQAAKLDTVRVLLEKGGADPNVRDSKGLTALHVAAGACRGLIPNYGEAVATKLAMKAGKLLLNHGADPDAAGNEQQTPLHVAAGGENAYTLLVMMLKRGASVNAVDTAGATPLHHAVRSRNAREVEALVKAGADPNFADAAGQLPGDALTTKDSTSMRMRNALENAAELRREALEAEAAAAATKEATKAEL